MIAQTPIATSPLIWPFRESTLWWGEKTLYPFARFLHCSQRDHLTKDLFFLTNGKKVIILFTCCLRCCRLQPWVK